MENEIDLGLSLGINVNQERSRSSSVGLCSNRRDAGANANSTTRPLSELVWSTQNGLTIKCATQILVSPRSITPAPFLGSSICHTDEHVGDVKSVHLPEMEKCNKGKEKECISSCESILAANVAGTAKRLKGQTILLAKEPENVGDGTDRFSLDFGLRLKMNDMTQSAGQAHERPTKEDDCTTAGCAPFLEKIEETAENDVILKNGENEDGQGESMNSGNNVISEGNKRWRFEEHLIIESKRIKKQSQKCPPPPVIKQQDSSFMNWISNMVKGIKPVGVNDKKKLNHVSKGLGLGFHSVFESLYSQDGKRPEETKTPVESSKSKEIILFNETVSYHVPNDDDDDVVNLNQKACDNLWITRLLTSNNKSTANVSASLGLKTSSEIDAFKDSRPTRLQINENKNILLKNKVSNFPKKTASTAEKKRLLNEDKILIIPKQMFETIKRLRLSRTDILKWMNSGLPVENLDGYFLRLRLAKWEERAGGSGYYVACITDENVSKGSKKSICVNVGGVQCLVESRYISNRDFLQDELVAWWRKSGQTALLEEKLTSKLEERNKSGF